MNISIEDSDYEYITKYFRPCYNFIGKSFNIMIDHLHLQENSKEGGGKTLVHCQRGCPDRPPSSSLWWYSLAIAR